MKLNRIGVMLLVIILTSMIPADMLTVSADSNTFYVPEGINPPNSLYSGYWDETGQLITYRIKTPIIRTGVNQDTIGAIIFPNIDGIDQYDLINNATLRLYFDSDLETASDNPSMSVWTYAYPVEIGTTLSDFEYNSLIIGGKATNVYLTNITSAQWVNINVKTQIQQLVNNFYWESGKGVCFLIFATSFDTARSYQSNIGLNIPELYIEYETPPTGETEQDQYIDSYRGVEIWQDLQGVINAQFVVYDTPNSTLYYLDKYYPEINKTINLPSYCAGSILQSGLDWYYIAKQEDGTGTQLNRVYSSNNSIVDLGDLYANEVEYDEQNNRLLFNETTNTFHTFFKRTSNLGFYYLNATIVNGSLVLGTVQEIETPLALQYGGVGSWVDVVEVKGYIYGATDCGHASTSKELMLFWCQPNDHDFGRRLLDNAYLTGTRGQCYVEVLEEIDQIYFFRRMNDFSGTSDNALWVSEIPFQIGDPITNFDNAWNYSEWEDFSYLSRTGSPAIYVKENNGTVTMNCVSQERVTNYINIQTWYDYQIGEGRGDQDYSSGDITGITNVCNYDLYKIANYTKMILVDTTTNDYYSIPRNDTNIWDWGGDYSNTEIDTLEGNTFDIIKEVSGSPSWYIIVNGTKIPTSCETQECVEALIDDLLGDDPVDPSGWEETPYFTRNLMKLYFLIAGVLLVVAPWFYYALVLKGFMKFIYIWIILFLNVIGLALLWHIPSL